jgi:hypothetical protein
MATYNNGASCLIAPAPPRQFASSAEEPELRHAFRGPMIPMEVGATSPAAAAMSSARLEWLQKYPWFVSRLIVSI